MDPAALSLPGYAGMVKVLERIWQHRRAAPSDYPSDLLYYELLLRYNRRILTAHDEGKPLIATGIYVPNEIIYALDIVPLHLENVPITYAILMDEGAELLSMAKSFGLPPEVCSNHRTIAAFFLQRLAPKVDGVVWTHLLCDNTAKIGELLTKTCQVPGFFLDRPYRSSERSINYLVGELESLVGFLKKVSGKRLKPERLEEAMDFSRQMIALSRELDNLRKGSLSPISNRKIYQLLFINWLYSGSPEAVQFYQAVRDEALVRRGLVPAERHRITNRLIIV